MIIYLCLLTVHLQRSRRFPKLDNPWLPLPGCRGSDFTSLGLGFHLGKPRQEKEVLSRGSSPDCLAQSKTMGCVKLWQISSQQNQPNKRHFVTSLCVMSSIRKRGIWSKINCNSCRDFVPPSSEKTDRANSSVLVEAACFPPNPQDPTADAQAAQPQVRRNARCGTSLSLLTRPTERPARPSALCLKMVQITEEPTKNQPTRSLECLFVSICDYHCAGVNESTWMVSLI